MSAKKKKSLVHRLPSPMHNPPLKKLTPCHPTPRRQVLSEQQYNCLVISGHFLWKDRFLCSIVHTTKEKPTPSIHTAPSVTFQLEPHSPGRTGSPVPSYTPQRRRPPTHTDQDGYTMGPPLRSQHAVPGCIWTLLWKDMCLCSFVLRLRH